MLPACVQPIPMKNSKNNNDKKLIEIKDANNFNKEKIKSFDLKKYSTSKNKPNSPKM